MKKETAFLKKKTKQQTSFHLTDFIQLAFSLEWQYQRTRFVHRAKTTQENKNVNKHDITLYDQQHIGIVLKVRVPLPALPCSSRTIQDVSQGN